MKFLVDNALAPRLAGALQEAGHDAVHLLSLGMESSSDQDIIKFAATSGGMRREKMIIAPANIFVKADVRRAAQTASLCILMKDSADEE